MSRYGDLRIVRLFGKRYWWDLLSDGRLTLVRAAWPESEPPPSPSLAEAVAYMYNRPLPWPPKEQP